MFLCSPRISDPVGLHCQRTVLVQSLSPVVNSQVVSSNQMNDDTGFYSLAKTLAKNKQNHKPDFQSAVNKKLIIFLFSSLICNKANELLVLNAACSSGCVSLSFGPWELEPMTEQWTGLEESQGDTTTTWLSHDTHVQLASGRWCQLNTGPETHANTVISVL